MTLILETTLEKKERQETYLRFQLNSQTGAIIPMKQMQEVLSVPAEKITPLPNMPSWIIGLLNQRNHIFWVMDLPQFLGLSPTEEDSESEQVSTHLRIRSNPNTYNIATVRVENFPIGLMVQQVYGVMRFPSEIIQSPIGTVAASIEPYLQGCVLHQDSILWVLEPIAIIKGAEAILANSNQ